MTMNLEAAAAMIAGTWRDDLIPQLHDYIAIPALSPAFDPDWESTGHIGRAADLIEEWIRSRPVAGMNVFRQEIEGRTPLLVAEIDPFGPDAPAAGTTTVLYGHLDKQPEMEGWREDLSPWTPVMEGSRLYGRGGADDGYVSCFRDFGTDAWSGVSCGNSDEDEDPEDG